MFGYLWEDVSYGSQILPDTKHTKQVKKFDSHWKDTLGTLAVHFPTNGARLPVPTEEEREEMDREGSLDIREALQVFAACELPLLMDPSARIDIIGHADRPDSSKRIAALSRNRAESVFNYLEGLLGDRLTWGREPESLAPYRLRLQGRGEDEATWVGQDDGDSDQSFRRVDVTVSMYDPTRPPDPKTGEAMFVPLTTVAIMGADDPAKGT